VQEREERVDSGEVKADEMVDQVRVWKGVTRRVEAGRCTFPLVFFFRQESDEQGKGRNELEHIQSVGSRIRVGGWRA
jgi:hypothetical protein